MQVESLGAREVRRVRDEAMVGTGLQDSETEVVGVARELVAIEKDLFGSVGTALPTAADGILVAFLRARQIPLAAPAGRHAQVGLLDASLDLLEDSLPQLAEVGQAGLDVLVLGTKVREDLLAFALPHPGIGIHHGFAVQGSLGELSRG